ncbi:MAG: Ada metal-binding domain-containing protein [Siphonobacter sp.]
MIFHTDLSTHELWQALRQKHIGWGGNKKLKIYGTLQCSSGKRMKKENRVFFASEAEALTAGYRPCGHCMRDQYRVWKHGIIQNENTG